MKDRISKKRRRLLQALGIVAASGGLPGCLMREPRPICPFDPRYTDKDSLLTIDVHTHIFNATDLQVKQFIKRVSSRQEGGIGRLGKYFGGVLQSIGWNAAPNVEKEMQMLAELKPAILACDEEVNLDKLRGLRDEKYQAAVVELKQEAENRLPALGLSSSDLNVSPLSLPPEQQGIRQIIELPDTYDEFREQQPATLTGLSEIEVREVNLKSSLQFVIEMFQYRFVSVYNYLDAYSAGSALKVDLLTPALVDYDWWLAQGEPTPSSLPDQMKLMKEISILSGGRVHALVPFDPYRQVVHDLSGASGFSPMELVRRSVEDYGAIGVKLYPPMGFAPFSNAGLSKWQDKGWLTEVAQRDDFPRRMDDCLARLYDYCADKEVPVMGHSNQSNGPSDDFEALTTPPYWQAAAEEAEDVSFSFGHFGGVGKERAPGESDVRGFLDLLVSDHRSGSSQLHADASYFSNLLDRPNALSAALEAVFRYGPADAGVAVDRLMYGSDWKMLAAEVSSGSYLDGFDSIISELETRIGAEKALRSKFFGRNAVEFLGLAQGKGNRGRLEKFYDMHKLRQPVWMDKVDNQV